MERLLRALKLIWTKILFRIPTPLPQGSTAFDEFAHLILSTYGIPDNESMRFALSNMIMRTEPHQNRIPKIVFVKALENQIAKEVAFFKDNELRKARKLREEMEASKAAEETLGSLQNAPIQSP